MNTAGYVAFAILGFAAGWHIKGAYTRTLRNRIERMQRRLRGL